MRNEADNKTRNTVRQELREFYFGMALPKRLLRFAGVGALSSLTYVAAVAASIEIFAIDAKWASALGYLIAIPLSFYGHRKVTFHSDGNPAWEFFRFLVMHAVNLVVCVAGMFWVVDWMGFSYWFGSLLAVILVPLATFLVMNVWVFPRATSQ